MSMTWERCAIELGSEGVNRDCVVVGVPSSGWSMLRVTSSLSLRWRAGSRLIILRCMGAHGRPIRVLWLLELVVQHTWKPEGARE